jgi:hypothetical protein
MVYIRIALILGIVFTAVEHLRMPVIKSTLPLGGDPFVQL